MFPIEHEVFEIGDHVRVRVKHRCKTPLLRLSLLSIDGEVVDVKGPFPPRVEAGARRTKDPERMKKHTFAYSVHYDCDRCQTCLEADYFLPDLAPYKLDS